MMDQMAAAPVSTGSEVGPRVLAAIIKLRELPAAAPVVQKALRLMDREDFAVTALKQVLMSDQAVAARILRLANSAYFGFRSEVQTVSQAVVLLGHDRIRTLLRRILVDKMWGEMSRGSPASGSLRERSLATATACCTMSQLLAREDAEEVLLAGLLHNIGDLFFFSQFPAESQRTGDSAEAQAAVFGMTAGRAGRLLVENWNFPSLYAAVAEHWSNPLGAEIARQDAFVVALVYAGRQLAEAMLAGADAAAAVARVSPDVCETFTLEPDLLGEVYQCLPERMSLEQLQAGRR